MRRMKESGVAWIGEIPTTWSIEKYKYHCNIQNGYPFDSANFTSDRGFPLIRIRDISSGTTETYYNGDYPDEYVVKEGDLLIGMDGDFNIRIWSSKPALLNQRCCRILEKNNTSKHFLYYTLPFVLDEICALTYSTTVKHLSSFDILDALFPVPSLDEQRRIADYLDTKCAEIDHSMELVRQGVDKLKEYKKSVITEAVTKGLDPDVPMKDSGVPWIGVIPQHWDVEPIKYLYDYSNGNAVCVGPFGSSLPSSEICDTGTWVYNQRVILDDNFDTNSICINEKKAKELSGFSVNPGDILITTRGSIGKIAIVPLTAHPGILHPCVIRFRINRKKYNIKLLKYIFNESDISIQQINYMNNSTTIGVLYSYSLKEIKLPTPPLLEQDTITSYLDAKCAEIDTLITEKQALLDKLAEYKKSLVFECVTGKREVAA